ncbi:MAG: glycosyltransferase [Cytophagaceae bacterium]|jgi:glycosyltransferase involved in cell wall biosynthesis|nr:glycosyltransferase [Cytophagaceae bacterium]
MKHCVYISYDGLTDFLGQSQVLPYIIGLEEKGYRFSILSFEKPEKYEKEKSTINALLQGKNIHWIPLTYHKRFSILATVYDIGVGWFTIKKLYKKDPFVLLHTRSYIATLIGWLFNRYSKVPFLFDMRGFWADERVEGGIWNLKNPLFKFTYILFKKLEKLFIRDAATIISLTELAKNEMSHWNIRSTDSFQVIPCCADLSHFNRNKIDENRVVQLKQTLAIPHASPIVLYLGSIGTWYMLEEMLDFFNIYKKMYSDALFLFVTGDGPQHIYEAATKQHIPHEALRIISSPKKDVPYYIRCATVSVFFCKPSYSKKASSPTKLPEILALGIPVICNDGIGDMTEQMHTCKGGYVITSFANTAYQQAIDFICQNPLEVSQLDQYLVEHFSLTSGINKYAAVYQKILMDA